MSASLDLPPAPARRAIAVWGVALAVYVLAVFHRSSLAVAGLAAADRFDISAAQLATFTMVQLLVYAGLQVPVGLVLDRFGPRRVLGSGLVVMTLAQIGFAFADTYLLGLVARVFVGAGDAMVFICVLRLATTWFAPRRIPLVTQFTGFTGQLGAVAAALPMTWALSTLGWTRAYLAAAVIGIVLAVLLYLVVADTPERRVVTGPPLSIATVTSSLRLAWGEPGTRLGFWTHFTAQFPGTVLGLLWGYPFFVRGEGLSPTQAGLLLTLLTGFTMAAGPVIAWFVANRLFHRSTLVLGIVGAIVTTWTAVLLWPGDAPVWLLVLLVMAAGVGGPASMIAFDFVRTFNPPDRLGSATGIVNQGGFIASLLTVIAIGVVLDVLTPGSGSDYSSGSFRWAMAVQYVLWTVGLTQVWRYRRRTRARLSRDDPDAYEALRRRSGPVPTHR
ncbi:MFS transporter [Solicola sp. PLA-1-18]|uniref:MFS transporter n=1 Tax=Solicola sp. PLA-1-18 TaxID=3380532 RepID=UPI003B820438